MADGRRRRDIFNAQNVELAKDELESLPYMCMYVCMYIDSYICVYENQAHQRTGDFKLKEKIIKYK